MPDSDLPQLHRLALEALPLAICVVNREGKILLWSAGAEQVSVSSLQFAFIEDVTSETVFTDSASK